jgi:hypothetical protein
MFHDLLVLSCFEYVENLQRGGNRLNLDIEEMQNDPEKEKQETSVY